MLGLILLAKTLHVESLGAALLYAFADFFRTDLDASPDWFAPAVDHVGLGGVS